MHWNNKNIHIWLANMTEVTMPYTQFWHKHTFTHAHTRSHMFSLRTYDRRQMTFRSVETQRSAILWIWKFLLVDGNQKWWKIDLEIIFYGQLGQLFNSNFLNRNECEQIWRWAWKFVKLIQAIKVCRWFCVLIKVYFRHLIFFFKCVLVGKTTNKVIFGSFHCNRHDAQKFTKIVNT